MRTQRTCAYCGQAGAAEDDHVVARQFFPPDERFRGGLPKVPCCSRCNRAKQRVEDGPAVVFQFGHDTDASSRLLAGRVRRTLAKNKRLLRSLQSGLHKGWTRRPSGLLIHSLAIELSPRELRDANRWFRLVTRGLYRYETGSILPQDHNIYLLKPMDRDQFVLLRDLIGRAPDHRVRRFAEGEFRYMFALNAAEELSMWLYAFKSVDIAAVTLGPSCPEPLKRHLARVEWSEPPLNG